MLLQKRDLAVVNAQALPDAVTEHEAAVENRHARLVASEALAIDVDLDARVTRVVAVLVGTSGLLIHR